MFINTQDYIVQPSDSCGPVPNTEPLPENWDCVEVTSVLEDGKFFVAPIEKWESYFSSVGKINEHNVKQCRVNSGVYETVWEGPIWYWFLDSKGRHRRDSAAHQWRVFVSTIFLSKFTFVLPNVPPITPLANT